MRILSFICLVLGVLCSAFCIFSDPTDKGQAILVWLLRYPALILVIVGLVMLIMSR